MADLEQKFEQAAKDVKNLKARPSDQQLLELYGLYKQATVGDCNQPKPGMLALKEKAKHEFWTKKAGMKKEKAMEEYIALVKQLIEQLGLKE
jgi:diazepam-binding inhibitor (GABA receptor modulating acyl-CoA-binding protein)